MPTFGYTIAGSTGSSMIGDRKWACRFTLPEKGKITKLTVYQKTEYVGYVKGIIYSDSNGTPDLLLSTTEQSKTTTSKQWLDMPFATPITLDPGEYWLGVIFKETIWNYHDDGTTDQTAYNPDSYTDGPSIVFGSSNYASWNSSIYATYTIFTGEPKLAIGIIGIA